LKLGNPVTGERALLQSFLQGLVIGFSIAAPVGPIGMLCIQRTLARGRFSGLASGLGAATADATYGGIAGFGVTFVSALLVHYQLWIRLLGGTFLILLGARILLSVPTESGGGGGRQRLAKDYASTFALTLSNPLTIVAFAAIFAGLGITGQAGDYGTATTLVSGVFAGSALWWVILSTGVGAIKGRLASGQMRWINRLSGCVIGCFGLIALLSLVV
jgi:threonine/homoserine/homoserine lactone efflux protein